MAQNTLFRIASITKPMTAALALTFVADGTVGLDDPVADLLPELAAPVVVRSVGGAVDDTVPASRPITLRHLTSTNSHPVFRTSRSRSCSCSSSGCGEYHRSRRVPPPNAWMAILGEIPLLHQPGDGFTYNAAFDILGVLVARAGGASLPDLMAGRLSGPLLGMSETRFAFPDGTDERRTSYYQRGDDGFVEQDGPDGQWQIAATVPVRCGRVRVDAPRRRGVPTDAARRRR